MTRFGMFRNTSVIKVALVPTTPTRESARLCDTLAIITHQEDQRSHAIAPVLLSLSDKHLRCLTVVYSCKPIFPSFSINTTSQTPPFEMPSLYISSKAASFGVYCKENNWCQERKRAFSILGCLWQFIVSFHWVRVHLLALLLKEHKKATLNSMKNQGTMNQKSLQWNPGVGSFSGACAEGKRVPVCRCPSAQRVNTRMSTAGSEHFSGLWRNAESKGQFPSVVTICGRKEASHVKLFFLFILFLFSQERKIVYKNL